jgi:hypothetical protein
MIFPIRRLLDGMDDRGVFTASDGTKRPAVKLSAPATGRRRQTKKTGAGKTTSNTPKHTLHSSQGTPRTPRRRGTPEPI